MRWLRHVAVYGLTFLLSKCILILPLAWGREFGATLGLLAFHLLGNERRKTLKNLKLAYGSQRSKDARSALGREVFRNAGRCAAEAAYCHGGRGGNIFDRTEIKGIEYAREVLQSGRGILLLTGHFGNWEIMAPLFVRHLDCAVGAVARDIANLFLNRMITDMRQAAALTVFRRGHTGRDYVRFLRSGNALGILGDINTKRGDGLYVDFLGRPAWTQRGIARLALMGNARIVPVFMVRDSEDPGRQIMEIHPALPEPQTSDREQWIREMTQAFTQEIEQAVKKRPDLWMWMHRRWRHQSARIPRVRLPKGKGTDEASKMKRGVV